MLLLVYEIFNKKKYMDKEDANLIIWITLLPWWDKIKEIVYEKIEDIENSLLNEFDNDIKYTKQDLNRMLRRELISFIDIPSDLLTEFKPDHW